jgi:hypothetical protein
VGIVSAALSHEGMRGKHAEYLLVLRFFLDTELVLADVVHLAGHAMRIVLNRHFIIIIINHTIRPSHCLSTAPAP